MDWQFWTGSNSHVLQNTPQLSRRILNNSIYDDGATTMDRNIGFFCTKLESNWGTNESSKERCDGGLGLNTEILTVDQRARDPSTSWGRQDFPNKKPTAGHGNGGSISGKDDINGRTRTLHLEIQEWMSCLQSSTITIQ